MPPITKDKLPKVVRLNAVHATCKLTIYKKYLKAGIGRDYIKTLLNSQD
jgi:hypothetical protein